MIDFKEIPKRTKQLLKICEKHFNIPIAEIIKDRTGLSKRRYRKITLIKANIYQQLINEFGYLASQHILKAMSATNNQKIYFNRLIYSHDFVEISKIFDKFVI